MGTWVVFTSKRTSEFLVKIAEELIRKYPNTHFLFIGDGSLRSTIAAEFEKMGLGRNVTFVPDTLSVPQFMLSAMDCFVFPSRYEGLGLVAVEAQAAGLPCFVSDRVPAEAIVDHKLVRVLPLTDPPELWADAILKSRGQKIQDTKHLGKFYLSPFNLEQCAMSLGAAYESLIKSGPELL